MSDRAKYAGHELFIVQSALCLLVRPAGERGGIGRERGRGRREARGEERKREGEGEGFGGEEGKRGVRRGGREGERRGRSEGEEGKRVEREEGIKSLLLELFSRGKGTSGLIRRELLVRLRSRRRRASAFCGCRFGCVESAEREIKRERRERWRMGERKERKSRTGFSIIFILRFGSLTRLRTVLN